MNRELDDLLEAASAHVREVDFAERAWEQAELTRTRTRRTVVGGVAAAAAVVAVVGAWVAGTGPAPAPANPAPTTTSSAAAAQWLLAPDGTRYVVGPAPGTEADQPHLTATAAGQPDRVDPGAARRPLSEVVTDPSWRGGDMPAALFLAAADGSPYADASAFTAVLARTDGSLVDLGLRLTWVRDASGERSVPLSAGSLNGRWAAFPQPGAVVLVDLSSARTTRLSVPSQAVEQVRWTGTRLVAAGADGAWQFDPASGDTTAERLPSGYTGAPDVVDVGPSGATVVTWRLEGLERTSAVLQAPATAPVGQSFSTNLTVASAVRLSGGLEQTGEPPAATGVLSVPLYDPSLRRLLALPGSTSDDGPCCQVVGYSLQRHPLFTRVTPAGTWLLQWDPDSGRVSRVLLLADGPDVPPVLSPGFSFTG